MIQLGFEQKLENKSVESGECLLGTLTGGVYGCMSVHGACAKDKI